MHPPVHIFFGQFVCLVHVPGLLLLLSELEVLGALDGELLLGLALLALHPQHDLPRRLGLLVEHGLGLAAEAHLLGVVAALALREVGRLAGLVLGHLVLRVLAALLALAEGPPELGEVNLGMRGKRYYGRGWP